MTVGPPPIPVRLPPDHDADGILLAAAQVAGRSILLGAAVAAVVVVLGLCVPALAGIGRAPVEWPATIAAAAAAGGVGAAAALAVCRALGWRQGVENILVPTGGLVLSTPSLLAFGVVTGLVTPVSAWVWLPTAAIVPLIAHRRELARPVGQWRPVLVRLLLAVVCSIGVVCTASAVPVVRPVPSSTGFDAGPIPGTEAPAEGPDFGESVPPDRPLPTLDEARSQFESLAEVAVGAAGASASWSATQPFTVVEVACEQGVMLTLAGEFTTGVITDTTSDEHDREVTERNLAAADRIVAAWQGAGLGTVEPLHGEPLLGGGELSGVQSAKIDFAFGVVQPRVDGRCLPVP
ncbi:hypothetical protein [Agromyces badenianii]|uniref:hypothetical protein n=1 Tax=Agromyces badenianii TaxID=2080742 RepID=UPI000D622650|nr:hypothetical protein [Agromyces badenianii]PWC03887.1 hypothetical protein DCE94_06715 [Agromyces badenianii]